MKEFIVYFEIYGKKMKVTINADSEEEAKKIIMHKIKFHKIVKNDMEFNSTIEKLKKIMFGGML